MTKPIAVLISDVHQNLNNMACVEAVLMQAGREAERLGVPFIIAGDLTDNKAIIRAECANALIAIFQALKCQTTVLVGNHDLINEKGKAHALKFLEPYVDVVQSPVYDPKLKSWLIPYMSDSEELKTILDYIGKGARIICHQGVQTAYMGHYVQDKTSLPKEAFADFRVISGHYHRRQDIKCGRPRTGAVGLFSYLGSPYTQSFGEASDGEKGFSVLHDDGLLTLIPNYLRKHRVYERTTEEVANMLAYPIEDEPPYGGPDDLYWLKVKGPKSELERLDKKLIGEKIFKTQNFKLDKIDTPPTKIPNNTQEATTAPTLMDQVIDSSSEPDKATLKKLWRDIVK